MILAPQNISVPVGGSCFAGVVGDVTNIGIGEAIASGVSGANPAAHAFDNSTGTQWQSENAGTVASYIGWNWSAAPDTCAALIRRLTIQQRHNATNGTKWASSGILEVSDNLTDWTLVHSFALSSVPSDSLGPLDTIDIPSPVLAKAARIRGTAFGGGGGVWMVAELEFIENVS